MFGRATAAVVTAVLTLAVATATAGATTVADPVSADTTSTHTCDPAPAAVIDQSQDPGQSEPCEPCQPEIGDSASSNHAPCPPPADPPPVDPPPADPAPAAPGPADPGPAAPALDNPVSAPAALVAPEQTPAVAVAAAAPVTAASVAGPSTSRARIFLSGAGTRGPGGCVKRSFTVSVGGAGIARIDFSLDGRILQRVTTRDASHLYRVVVSLRGLTQRTHRISARVAFRRGFSPRTTTLPVTFRRCAQATSAPAFTG